MKRTILLVALAISLSGMLQAQPNEAALVAKYGAIRADMIRDICELVDVNKILKFHRNILCSLSSSHHEKKLKENNTYSQKIKGGTNKIRTVEKHNKEKTNQKSKKTTNSNKSQTKGKKHSFFNFLTGIIATLALLMTLIYVLRKKLWLKIKGNKTFKVHGYKDILQTIPKYNERNLMPLNVSDELNEEVVKNDKEDADSESDKLETEKSVEMPVGGQSTSFDADEWIVVGTSVQGNGHLEMNIPCQDSHAYEYLSDGWGIAIVSDGAGSAKLSHKGSSAIVARAMYHFKSVIKQKGWMSKNSLPSDVEWMKTSYHTLKLVHNEIVALSKRMECDAKDLSATVIVVVHSPMGLMVVHIGDGRAGYKDFEGNWHSMITPHKGEEANQTIFVMSDFWNIPFYEMSGVMVPESMVIRKPVSAFTLMSDGCESTSWLCNQYNEDTAKYYDPNTPFAKFFDSLIETLRAFREDNIPLEERKSKWFNFIKSGNKSFIKETDDKTMILACLHRNPQSL